MTGRRTRHHSSPTMRRERNRAGMNSGKGAALTAGLERTRGHSHDRRRSRSLRRRNSQTSGAASGRSGGYVDCGDESPTRSQGRVRIRHEAGAVGNPGNGRGSSHRAYLPARARSRAPRGHRRVREFGAETALTIDALRKGYRIVEPLPLTHRLSGRTLKGFLHRGHQLWDISKAIWRARIIRRSNIERNPILAL